MTASWRSVKKSCIVDSTIKAKYVVAFEATKEAISLGKFLMGLGVIPLVAQPMTLFCNNIEVVAQYKEPINH